MDASPDERAQRLLARAAARGERVPDEDRLLDWLAAPASEAEHVGRYLTEIWSERVDLQEAFPGLHLDADQRERFLLWAHHFAAVEAGAPESLLPAAPDTAHDLAAPARISGRPPIFRRGLTVVGYLRAVLGLGGSARRLAHLARMAGEEVREIAYDHTTSPLDHPWSAAAAAAAAGDATQLDIVALCVNGAQTERLTRALGPAALQGRYRIGLWFWELEHFPPDQAAGFAHVDEVWVTSPFVADAIRAAAPDRVGVHIIPLGTDVAIDHVARGDDITRAQLGLPEGVLLGITFDYASRVARKNPLGLIDAFCRAFPNSFELGRRGPFLVLKTLNNALHPEDAAAVQRAAAAHGRDDIVVIDRQFAFAEQRAFLRELDVLVSLHRSEGYGNSLLEAMGHGHPVIATGYSGNLAFMTDANSWLVPATLVPVPAGTGIYDVDARWADPDLDEAARAMREVALGLETPHVRRRADRARTDVAAELDGRAGAAFILARLATIRAAR